VANSAHPTAGPPNSDQQVSPHGENGLKTRQIRTSGSAHMEKTG